MSTRNSEIVNAKTGAAMLGISVPGFWLSVRQNRLPKPFYPLSKCPRWRVSELLSALEQTRDRPVERVARAARARSTTLGNFGDQQSTT